MDRGEETNHPSRRLTPWFPAGSAIVAGYGGSLAVGTGAWGIVCNALMVVGALALFGSFVRSLIRRHQSSR